MIITQGKKADLSLCFKENSVKRNGFVFNCSYRLLKKKMEFINYLFRRGVLLVPLRYSGYNNHKIQG